MRITFCITNDITYDQRMHRISLALISEGHQVIIIGRNKSNSKEITNQPFSQKRINCFFTKGKFFYIEFNIRLFLLLLCQRTDLIGSIDLDTIIPVYLASFLRFKKRSFDAHELFPEVPELVGRPRIKSVWQWIERVFIKRFPIRYTVSQSIADFYYRKYNLRFGIIRNLPMNRLSLYRKKRGSAEKYILYQGALNEGRGLIEMIHAMLLVDEYTLKIAGDGDLAASLKLLVQELNLQEKVFFLGNLSPTALASVTVNATIGINLLENRGLSYYYSLANKFFDYIQAEIPSITMNFPEYAAINQIYKVAALINDLEVSSIISAIHLIEKDYQEMKLNCQNASEIYNWENEAIQLVALYK